MIKILWISCSTFVFINTLKYCIKDELDTYGEVEPGIVIVMLMLSFVISWFGPLAILGYILYNILENIVDGINEKHQNKIR